MDRQGKPITCDHVKQVSIGSTPEYHIKLNYS